MIKTNRIEDDGIFQNDSLLNSTGDQHEKGAISLEDSKYVHHKDSEQPLINISAKAKSPINARFQDESESLPQI